MAITRCNACGKRTSTLADRCSHCGVLASEAPAPRKPSLAGNFTLHYLVAAILFLAGALMYSQTFYGHHGRPSLLANVLLYGGLAWYAIARCASWIVGRG